MEIISFITAGTIVVAVAVFFASATILMIAKTAQLLRKMSADRYYEEEELE